MKKLKELLESVDRLVLGEGSYTHTCSRCHRNYQCNSVKSRKLVSLVVEANRLAADYGYSECLDETTDVCKKCLRGFLFDVSRAIRQKVSTSVQKTTRKDIVDENELQDSEANSHRLKKLALPNGEYDIWLVEKKLKEYSRRIRIESRSLSMDEP